MTDIASRSRPDGQHPVGEIEYPDHELLKAGGSLSEHGIAYRDRPPGYRAGSLSEARTAFLTAFPGLDARWPADTAN
jgi:hypothetical protein